VSTDIFLAKPTPALFLGIALSLEKTSITAKSKLKDKEISLLYVFLLFSKTEESH